MTTENPERDRAIVAAVRGGDSLRAVGKRYGISHERVRQLVEKLDPGATLAGQTRRAEANLARQRARVRPSAPSYTKVCPQCGRTFTTTDRRRVTDSPECATAWAKGGRHRGAENMARHQDNVARSVLRHADKHTPAKVAWARRRVEDRGLDLDLAS